jgi:hypothetical protein
MILQLFYKNMLACDGQFYLAMVSLGVMACAVQWNSLNCFRIDQAAANYVFGAVQK